MTSLRLRNARALQLLVGVVTVGPLLVFFLARIRRRQAPRILNSKLDLSILAQMDKDMLKKQIENMKFQATMERWPLSKSIAA